MYYYHIIRRDKPVSVPFFISGVGRQPTIAALLNILLLFGHDCEVPATIQFSRTESVPRWHHRHVPFGGDETVPQPAVTDASCLYLQSSMRG